MTRPALWIRDARVELRYGVEVAASRECNDVCDLTAAIEAVEALLVDHKVASIDLVLSSYHAYTHEVSVAVRRPSDETLRYAFEEFVPVDIERLTCVFERCGPDRWLGIGVETAPIHALLSRVDELGVTIERVTLDVVAIANVVAAERVRVIDDQHRAELERIGAGAIAGIAVRRGPTSSVAADGPLASSLVESGSSNDDCSVQSLDDPLTESPGGPRLPPLELNLAVGELALGAAAVRPLRAARDALALACVALLVLAIGLWGRQRQAHDALEQVRAWEASLFTTLFPAEETPRSVSLRLRSERKRLDGAEAGPEDRTLLDPLSTLREVVLALPREARIQIDQIQIEPRDVLIRGAARDHAQAETFARKLDGLDMIVCGAPRTERMPDRGVQFFLHATAEDKESANGP
ncbi:MAG: hypothetical protein KDA32_08025 [Phycisphaerales bacterium]|nr:hypothetical protein [Phycisphaerales bacterium]